MPSSRSCSLLTSEGVSSIRETAWFVFGNAMTSLIEGAPHRSITNLSNPNAAPPWGGGPNSNAFSKNPNFSCALSSVNPRYLNIFIWTSRLWILMEQLYKQKEKWEVITNSGLRNWRGPYIKSATIPLDPWGNEYQYRYPSQLTSSGFLYDIISPGPDGVAGNKDDVTNHDDLANEQQQI